MQSPISQKDIALIKTTYRKLTQQFYQNNNSQTIIHLICLHQITKASLTSINDIKLLSLHSVLEILKLKSKNVPQLVKQTQEIILYLFNPSFANINNSKCIIQGLSFGRQCPQLYILSCTLLIRFIDYYKQKLNEDIIWIVGDNCMINMSLSVQFLLLLVQQKNQFILKSVIKSGMTKYLLSNYLTTICQNGDLLNLYKGLKLLQLSSKLDINIIKQRQKCVSNIIYQYEQYIPITKDILSNSYDQDYIIKLLKKIQYPLNIDSIDKIYLWSYYQSFCQQIIDIVPQIQLQLGSALKRQINDIVEAKIYAILANIAKYNKKYPFKGIQFVPKYQKALKSCIKLAEVAPIQLLNMNIYNKLQQLSNKSNDSRIPKQLAKLSARFSTNKKINALKPQMLDMFSDKNPQMLFQKASLIPSNKQDLDNLNQIINAKQPKSLFEADCLRKAKKITIESLLECILTSGDKTLTIQQFNRVLTNFVINNVSEANRIIQIIQIYLLQFPDSIDSINQKRVRQIIQYLQDQCNYSKEKIDWGACQQVLEVIFVHQQKIKQSYLNHVLSNYKQCYWMLTIEDPSQQHLKRIVDKLKQMDPLNHKFMMLVGFLSKSSLQIRNSIIKQLYKTHIAKVISKKPQYAQFYQFSSFLIANWEQIDDKCIKEIIQKQIIPNIFKLMTQQNAYSDSQQACLFLSNSLPLRPNNYSYKSLNKEKILMHHGQFSYQIFKNQQGIISNKQILDTLKLLIKQIQKRQRIVPQQILQILKFLNNQQKLIKKESIGASVTNIIDIIINVDKKYAYWKMYPHYLNIMLQILSIIRSQLKSNNEIIKKQALKEMERLFQIIIKNKQFTEDQYDEIIQQLVYSLEQVEQSQDIFIMEWFDINIYRQIYIHIRQQCKQKCYYEDKVNKISQKIKTYLTNKVKKVQTKAKLEQNKYINIQKQQKFNMKKQQAFNSNKKQTAQIQLLQINIKQQQKNRNYVFQKTQDKQIILKTYQKQVFSHSIQIQKKQTIITESITQQLQYQKQKQILLQKDGEINIQLQEKGTLNQKQLTLIQAIKKLKEVVQGREKVQILPILLKVFFNSQVLQKYRQVLGYLLSSAYQISQHSSILQLLLIKNKTTLNKKSCYSLLQKYPQAFVLSKRYRLLCRQGLKISCQRMSYKKYLADALFVAQYNLVKPQQLEFFRNHSYHEKVFSIINNVTTQEQIKYYLLLIGTSSKLNDIRMFYLKKNLPSVVATIIVHHYQHYKILCNGCFALSSMLHLQVSQSAKFVKDNKSQFNLIFKGFEQHCKSQFVIQSGCCLISNLTYNNQEVKEILYNQKIIKILLLFFTSNLQNPNVDAYRHILRALGNCCTKLKCCQEVIDNNFGKLAINLVQNLQILTQLSQQKIKLLKVLIDLLCNLTTQKYEIKKLHSQGILQFILTLLETKQLNSQIIMGCVDTIDGMCQQNQIEKQLMSNILKTQQHQKVITKSVRLLTNLTMKQQFIPLILQANLLSVLGNIILLQTRSQKFQGYINKILLRIYQSQQPIKLLLKSGYLDCLVKVMQVGELIQDIYVDMMVYYSKMLPNFLNKRAFMCMIKVLTTKLQNRQIIQKSIGIFKTLLNMSGDQDQQDLVIQGSPTMYEKLLDIYPIDILYLLGSHCIRSNKLRNLIKNNHPSIIQILKSQIYTLKVTANMDQNQKQNFLNVIKNVLFIIYNQCQPLIITPSPQQQEESFKLLKSGIKCKLYRSDGSCKDAVVDISDEYLLRSYKFPNGEIKKKYTLFINQIKDWHFDYNCLSQSQKELWKQTVFYKKQQGFFNSNVICTNCVSLMGGLKWGEFVDINLQFQDGHSKSLFILSLMVLMKTFGC